MIRPLALAMTLSLSAAALSVASPRHFDLAKSAPEADATVHHLAEVRLWFTAPPQDGATSIRLLSAEGEVVPTGDVSRDGEDHRVFSVALPTALAAGAYTVAWRSMADDGHVVRGDFAFSVMAH